MNEFQANERPNGILHPKNRRSRQAVDRRPKKTGSTETTYRLRAEEKRPAFLRPGIRVERTCVRLRHRLSLRLRNPGAARHTRNERQNSSDGLIRSQSSARPSLDSFLRKQAPLFDPWIRRCTALLLLLFFWTKRGATHPPSLVILPRVIFLLLLLFSSRTPDSLTLLVMKDQTRRDK